MARRRHDQALRGTKPGSSRRGPRCDAAHRIEFLDAQYQPFEDPEDVTRFEGRLEKSHVDVARQHQFDRLAAERNDDSAIPGQHARAQHPTAVEELRDPVGRQDKGLARRGYGAEQLVAEHDGERSEVPTRLESLDGVDNTLTSFAPSGFGPKRTDMTKSLAAFSARLYALRALR